MYAPTDMSRGFALTFDAQIDFAADACVHGIKIGVGSAISSTYVAGNNYELSLGNYDDGVEEDYFRAILRKNGVEVGTTYYGALNGSNRTHRVEFRSNGEIALYITNMTTPVKVWTDNTYSSFGFLGFKEESDYVTMTKRYIDNVSITGL